MKKLIILFFIIIIILPLTTCENQWMKDIVSEYVWNIEDFGHDAEVIVINTTGANLQEQLSSISSASGNYVINVKGSGVIYSNLSLSGDVNVSLRGDGGTITMGETGFNLNSNSTLILRDITLISNGPAILNVQNGGTVIMEAGSHLTGSGYGAVVIEGGTFIMNGGSIYGYRNIEFWSTSHVVNINPGTNTHFEKNPGAIIYGNDEPEGLRNTSESGQVIVVKDASGGISHFRNSTVGADETLSITLDGDVIIQEVGTWDPPWF